MNVRFQIWIVNNSQVSTQCTFISSGRSSRKQKRVKGVTGENLLFTFSGPMQNSSWLPYLGTTMVRTSQVGLPLFSSVVPGATITTVPNFDCLMFKYCGTAGGGVLAAIVMFYRTKNLSHFGNENF